MAAGRTRHVEPEIVGLGLPEREGVVLLVALAHEHGEAIHLHRPETPTLARHGLPRHPGRHATVPAFVVEGARDMSEFDLSPQEVRRLGYLAADLVAGHPEELLPRPVLGKGGPNAALFHEPLPEEGMEVEPLLAFVREHVLRYPFGNSHPRFFGFINATADPLGTIADYLASAMNSNCWGGDHAAVHVEDRALRWLAEIVGLPGTAEGILTSGGSMANFTALAAARRAVAPTIREEGPRHGPPLVVYASEEVHNCVDKAVDLLGLGTRQLRKIPTDERFRIRVDLLKEAVARDRKAGPAPPVVVGTAGP